MTSLFRKNQYEALITNLITLNDKGYTVKLPKIDSNNSHKLIVEIHTQTAVLVIV